MKKASLIISLIIIAVLCLLTTGAYAVVDGYKYTLNNGTATVCLGSDGIYGIVASTAYLSGTFTAILRLVPQS